MRARIVFAGLMIAAAPAAASETITYTYDALGRLVAVTRAGSVNNGAAASYSYDPANNRTNVTTTAPTGGGGMARSEPPSPKNKRGPQTGSANGHR